MVWKHAFFQDDYFLIFFFRGDIKNLSLAYGFFYTDFRIKIVQITLKVRHSVIQLEVLGYKK